MNNVSNVQAAALSVDLQAAQKQVSAIPLGTQDGAEEFLKAVNGPDADEALLARIESLRTEQIEIEDRHFVPGRTAIVLLVGKAYAVYHDTMKASKEQQDAIDKRLTHLLSVKDAAFKPRSNTTLASLFLQYVFCKLDAKQRHLFGTAMNFAQVRDTAPGDFASFVKANGGFEKIRAACAKKKAGTPDAAADTDTVGAAVMMLQAKEAIETLVPDQLDLYEDEKVIVLFGVRQDDGSVAIVNAELTEEESDNVVRMYVKSMKELAAGGGKGKRRRLTEAERKQKAKMKGDIAYREQLIAEHDFNLKDAKAKGHLDKVETLQATLMVERSMVKALKAALMDVNKQLAGEV